MTETETAQRVKLTIAYDGESFKGWQSQPEGNSVQDAVEEAIEGIVGELVRIHGSGRTDAGVHALGQVAHFDLESPGSMDETAWRKALNSKLPRRIRVVRAEFVDQEFHARYSATGKYYRYRIIESPVLMPQDYARAWHQRGPLDRNAMTAACNVLQGEHDFSAFCTNRGDGTDRQPGDGGNVRNIDLIRLIEQTLPCGSTEITLHFHGNGFLYKMVRMMTGTIVRCGQGKMTIDEVRELLDQPNQSIKAEDLRKAPLCAPADGLTLVEVVYPQ